MHNNRHLRTRLHTPPSISEVPLRLVRAPNLALVGFVVVAVWICLPTLPAGRPSGVTAALLGFGFQQENDNNKPSGGQIKWAHRAEQKREKADRKLRESTREPRFMWGE